MSVPLHFITHSLEQTLRLGERLGQNLRAGDVVCLSGDLGAGKTTLVTGLARGWGTTDLVTSPTFVLVNEYRRSDGQRLRHLDCYRLNSAAEALALGFEDLLAETDSAMIIEWPERIRTILPTERLHLYLSWHAAESRAFQSEAYGARAEQLVDALQPVLAELN